jgi:tRNA threonylcarbamoyladenosine biosynthesis protein TsaE
MIMQHSVYLPSEQATEQFACILSQCIHAPCVLTFSGEIGMGKTTLIRALFRSMGITESVKSPTFSLVEHYAIESLQVVLHHLDLYRVADTMELEYIGFRDFFTPQAICCIEWPERVDLSMVPVDIAFSFTQQGSGREIMMRGKSVRGCECIGKLQ